MVSGSSCTSYQNFFFSPSCQVMQTTFLLEKLILKLWDNSENWLRIGFPSLFSTGNVLSLLDIGVIQLK
jgi:hypothetical protein